MSSFKNVEDILKKEEEVGDEDKAHDLLMNPSKDKKEQEEEIKKEQERLKELEE